MPVVTVTITVAITGLVRTRLHSAPRGRPLCEDSSAPLNPQHHVSTV